MISCSFNANDKSRVREKGYILLVLLLFVALLSLSFLSVLQRIDFEIKRDRENEMIHRGVQYSRAIRNFINKFHRYPNSIEELENTNNLHFLRKRYKDPITGKDFRVLHLTDMPGFISQPAAGVPATNPASQSQPLQALNNASSTSTVSGETGAGDAGSFGASSQGDAIHDNAGTQGSASQDDQNSSSVPPSPPSLSLPGALGPDEVSRAAHAMVIGVVSASKQKAIRVFDRQDHYDQWLFIYDPSATRSGIITTPSQPPLQAAIKRNPQQNEQALPLGSASSSGVTNPPTGRFFTEPQ